MNVYLRALEFDYKLINQWRNDEYLRKFLGGNVFFVSSEREKKFVESKIFNDEKDIYFAICDRSNNEMIGYCSISNIDLRNLTAEWSGTLIGKKECLGKGYGEESAKLMLRFLFEQYPIHKCYTSCLQEHPATIKLFEKLGFKQEGILRDNIYKNGKFKNVVLYSILREEINNNFE